MLSLAERRSPLTGPGPFVAGFKEPFVVGTTDGMFRDMVAEMTRDGLYAATRWKLRVVSANRPKRSRRKSSETNSGFVRL